MCESIKTSRLISFYAYFILFVILGSTRGVRRRPGTAQGNTLALSFSLHTTSIGGNSKKFSVALDSAEAAILAAGIESGALGANGASGKFGASGLSSKSNKFTAGASMKGGFSSKSGKLSSLNTAANAGTGSGPGVANSEEGSAAAVLAKMAFEKFLLRLEVVSMYNMWITTEQVREFFVFQ